MQGLMLMETLIANNPKTFRFGSSGPYYVEVGGEPRVSKKSAQFFLEWVDERAGRVKLEDTRNRDEVMVHHAAARKVWNEIVESANAE